MRQQIKLQQNIIERVQYLLEEASVIRASEADPVFAKYIDQLYEDLDRQAAELNEVIPA